MKQNNEIKSSAQGAEVLNVKQLYASNFIKAALGTDSSRYNNPFFCRPDFVVQIWQRFTDNMSTDLDLMFSRWLEISLAESIAHPSSNYEWCTHKMKQLATKICQSEYPFSPDGIGLMESNYMKMVKQLMKMLWDIEPDDYMMQDWPQDQVGEVRDLNKVDRNYLKHLSKK